jgi:hypothetical protein
MGRCIIRLAAITDEVYVTCPSVAAWVEPWASVRVAADQTAATPAPGAQVESHRYGGLRPSIRGAVRMHQADHNGNRAVACALCSRQQGSDRYSGERSLSQGRLPAGAPVVA